MIAYIDTSVLLRFVLGQRNSLGEWSEIAQAVTSELTQVESLRTLDRLRLAQHVSEEILAQRRAYVFSLLDAVDLIAVDSRILARASQPFPTTLGTLDAFHLASALLWRDETGAELTLATHDAAQATAARAVGLPTVGC